MRDLVDKLFAVADIEPGHAVYLGDVRHDHCGDHRIAEESSHYCGPALAFDHDLKTTPLVIEGSNRDLRCQGLLARCQSVLIRAGPRSGSLNYAVRRPQISFPPHWALPAKTTLLSE
jgi:hypothetical protein